MAFARLPEGLFRKQGIWVTIPVLVLHPPYTKVAISLPDLVRQTNAFSVKRRAGCTPVLQKSRPKELYLEYKVTCHENYSDPKGHDCQVQFDLSTVEKTQDAKRLDVRCSCSCPAFLYWGAQWNLHQRDGLHGEARPLLQAPTQRLDLRGNFVICKHLKAVFERILPAVQHNIVNIVRERKVRQNKERIEQAPLPEKEKKLREKQDELRMKNKIDKIVKVKDEDRQRELIDELLRQEDERLQKEKAPAPLTPPQALAAPAGPAPPPAPAPPAKPEAKTVVKRDEPATVKPSAAPPKKAPAPPDMRDMIRREEEKLKKPPRMPKEAPKPPVGVKPREELRRKRTSLEASLLGIVAGVRDKYVVKRGDGMVLTDPMSWEECDRWVREHNTELFNPRDILNISIEKVEPGSASWSPEFSDEDRELMRGMNIQADSSPSLGGTR